MDNHIQERLKLEIRKSENKNVQVMAIKAQTVMFVLLFIQIFRSLD